MEYKLKKRKAFHLRATSMAVFNSQKLTTIAELNQDNQFTLRQVDGTEQRRFEKLLMELYGTGFSQGSSKKRNAVNGIHGDAVAMKLFFRG